MPSDASRSLEYLNTVVWSQPVIMIIIGSDKQGAQHYLMFGVRYPRDDDDAKGRIKNDIFDCLNYVS
jgi:hypothetical protein